MWNGRVRAFVAAFCLGLPFVAATAGEPVPVEAFAHRGGYSMPRLSPDGKYLAIAVEQGEDHAVVIFQLSDMSHMKSLLRLPRFQLPADIHWTGPERLVVEMAKFFGSLDEPELLGEIIATDVQGKHIQAMFSREWGLELHGRGHDEGYAFVAGTPPKANDHFYMQTYMWNDENNTWLYDVNADGGARHQISQIGVGNMGFTLDADGHVRYASGLNTLNKYVVYRQQNNQWVQLSDGNDGNRFVPIAFSQDNQHLYAFVNTKGGPSALVQTDASGSQTKLLAKDDFSSIGFIQWTPQQQPFAAASATGVPNETILDASLPLAQTYQGLSQKFPGQFVDFSSYSEDGNMLVFEVSSDRNPGAYYLFDFKQMKIQKLFDRKPGIDAGRMGQRMPMHFTASDGTPLEAILTVPAGASMKDLPMVLLPHGGPFDVKDTWFFDEEAQFLASRGYLVLQVNYRGSSGRGPGFVDTGYGKWGTRIQQDLLDGVKWAEAQHYADSKRVCVFGASFGGYSAMMTVIREPGLFKCAIGYAGIYDLAMMYEKGDVKDRKAGRNYLEQAIGKDPNELAANSPDKLADKINVPVLLIHGEEDQRAPFAQAKAMRAALDAAHKPYEWLTKPGEGHGYYNEQNLVDMYNHVQAFLEKNIGPGVRPN
ncbi:S9 family peptidase [Dyella choica]|uniref:S9 family peptidase n=1 Tax=Dyella choica TaxID=1927959 RepID=A0A3S0PPG2_9GAMM|nr:prolyl oligopeptidase family serine peptidase [Dyella choica]RUL76801.1 S9 family peptidase [Dyella choica]